MTIIDKFYDHALRTGGATMNLKGECPISGYMVGLYPELTRGTILTTDQIERFVSDNYQMIGLPDNYIGVWFDGDQWVYDVSKCIDSIDDAMIEAKRAGQDAIYCLADGHEIFMQ